MESLNEKYTRKMSLYDEAQKEFKEELMGIACEWNY
jgi:hypothetical protein